MIIYLTLFNIFLVQYLLYGAIFGHNESLKVVLLALLYILTAVFGTNGEQIYMA
jgi:uncharacterized membrane protein